jgi:predicted RNA-binding Zn ribbon-like protein
MSRQTPDFVFLGNNAAVDFINTEIVSHGELVDLLQHDADFIRWAGAAGFDLMSTLNAGDLSAAKQLRSALKDLFHARMERRYAEPEPLATVNRHLENHATHEVLQISASGGDFELVPDKTASSATALLAKLAYEGAVLLASPQASQLKHCGNPECVLIFLDTSRNQQRRWCSMDTCGNRAKVAKHYRKQIR